jgi:hypothetical protein
METKRIVVVHGQKGGIGKSLVSSLLVELAPTKPLIVECDDSAPDVARRYRNHGYEGIQIQLLTADSPADALSDMMSSVEDAPEPLIVINLPAAAGAVVDTYAEQIREVADGLNRTLIAVFVIGAGQDSLAAALKCAQSGLASVAHRRVAVLNKFFGSPARLGWNDETRAHWRGDEVILPELATRVVDRIRTIDEPLHMIADPDNRAIPIGDRSLLKRWLRECEPLRSAVYE